MNPIGNPRDGDYYTTTDASNTDQTAHTTGCTHYINSDKPPCFTPKCSTCAYNQTCKNYVQDYDNIRWGTGFTCGSSPSDRYTRTG